jgi:hypothetical protein
MEEDTYPVASVVLSELGVHGLLPDTGEQVTVLVEVTRSISLTVEQNSDGLCSALEGGSTYSLPGVPPPLLPGEQEALSQ